MLAVVCEAGRVQLSIAAVPVGGGGVDGGGGGRRPAALVLRAAGGCCCAHIKTIYIYIHVYVQCRTQSAALVAAEEGPNFRSGLLVALLVVLLVGPVCD